MSNYYLIIYIQYGIKVPAAPAPVGNHVMNLSMCPLCTTETCRNKANLVKIHDSFKTSVMSHPLIKICKMCKKQTPEMLGICFAEENCNNDLALTCGNPKQRANISKHIYIQGCTWQMEGAATWCLVRQAIGALTFNMHKIGINHHKPFRCLVLVLAGCNEKSQLTNRKVCKAHSLTAICNLHPYYMSQQN